MAAPNSILPGFSFALFAQDEANPVPLTVANLSVWTGQVANIVGTDYAGTGTGGVQIPAETIPAYGFDDASVTYGLAGSRFSDKIPVQAAPKSMTITCAFTPADLANTSTGVGLIYADARRGTVDRTFVVVGSDFAATPNVFAFAFNARVGAFDILTEPGAEGKFNFTIHPRGGAYGTSANS